MRADNEPHYTHGKTRRFLPPHRVLRARILHGTRQRLHKMPPERPLRGREENKMNKELPERKRNRLRNFDYSSSGAYFITICTKDRRMLFAPVGADSISARMIERTFLETIEQYDGVDSPIYVVMPNHFHAIITITRADMESAPTVSEIVQSFKRYSTVEYTKMVKDGILPPFDKQIWQRSFYDHIIRNSDDYNEVYKYIYNNPRRWYLDELYYE